MKYGNMRERGPARVISITNPALRLMRRSVEVTTPRRQRAKYSKEDKLACCCCCYCRCCCAYRHYFDYLLLKPSILGGNAAEEIRDLRFPLENSTESEALSTTEERKDKMNLESEIGNSDMEQTIHCFMTTMFTLSRALLSSGRSALPLNQAYEAFGLGKTGYIQTTIDKRDCRSETHGPIYRTNQLISCPER